MKTERKRHRILQIRLGNLLDLLSEMLVLERNSSRLLCLARDRSDAPDVREALDRFVERVEHASDRLQTMIRDLGGNPVFRSEAAQIQETRLESALDLEIPSKLQAVVDLENAWYAAIEENMHLAFLRSVLPFVESIHAQESLEAVLEETREQHEERLDWLEQALHNALLRRAIRPVEVERSGFLKAG